ncbi:MAG TPA: HEAT repeat domain-containing protein [Longimicrobiaceae bacterium]|nr:HEAT repeat domain-containing protein [Longimicrobiaceae bacterium]
MKRTPPLVTFLVTLVLAGCATARPAAAPRPVALGDADVEAVATLLRLEDRREYDSATLERISASSNPELRRRTALAVGRIRERRGLPLLVRLLADPDTAVAATAAFALGHLGDTAAVPVLVPFLTPQRAASAPTIVGEAALALGKLRTERGREAVEGFLRDVPLEGSGSRAMVGHALLAVWRFPRGGNAASVTRWLDSPDPELRWRAAYALTRRPDPAATLALARLAEDPDWRTRSFVMRGLTAPLADSSSLGTRSALRLLLVGLGDRNQAVRVSAARSLGTYPDPSSVGALVGALSGGDPHLAIAAAESLGRLGTGALNAAAALHTVALDTARTVSLRTAALAALAEAAPDDAAMVAARFAADSAWRARAAAARAYARVGPIPRPELDALVRDRDPRVVAAALEAVVGAPGAPLPALRPLLLESLRAADPIVRTNALTGLARLSDSTTLSAVLDAYGRAQRDTLNDAALAIFDVLEALRRAGTPVSGTFFARFDRSPDYLVRQRAVAAFGDTAARAWGPPLPVDTRRDPGEYIRIVREWVVPALAGRRPRARIVTESGTIDLDLYAADAPLTVASFLGLAERGYFNGQEWPRVVPNFVIQGGDPRGDTSGGPGYAIRDEINRHPYGRGTLGMALSGPDTGGSQFFITHSPQPHLDGGYTVFGQVTDGLATVDRVVVGERITRIVGLR